MFKSKVVKEAPLYYIFLANISPIKIRIPNSPPLPLPPPYPDIKVRLIRFRSAVKNISAMF